METLILINLMVVKKENKQKNEKGIKNQETTNDDNI
jgi:hypothetical protein